MNIHISLDTALKIAQIVSYVCTPLIAVFVATVTLRIQRRQVEMQKQQTATNQSQHRFVLMEHRMTVFSAVSKFVTEAGAGCVKYEELSEFLADTTLHPILFGKEISDYIDDLYKRGSELARLAYKLEK